MSAECFVPNCKNTSGVPFPRDQKIKKDWLDGLKIKKKNPKAGDFVCLDHFKASDINNDNTSGTRASNKIKRGAVPCIPNPKKSNEESKTSKTLVVCLGSRNGVEEMKVVKRKVPGKNKTAEDSMKKVDDFQAKYTEEVAESVEQTNDSLVEVKICRVCTTEKNIEKRITDYIENEVTIMATLMLCAFPLEISRTDNFPKYICKQCLKELKIAHSFRSKCLNTDEKLHQEIENSFKRKQQEPAIAIPITKKPKFEDIIRISVGEVDIEDHEFKSEVVEHHDEMQETDPLGNIEANIEPAVPDEIVPDENEIVPDEDEIEKNMEEIHRSSIDTQVNATETASTETQSSSLEQIFGTLEENAKANEQKKKTPLGRIIVKKFSTGPETRHCPLKELAKVEKIYKSRIGSFEISVLTGPYNNSFYLADGYLFELGLVKKGARHLKCVVPNCNSTGSQRLLESLTFENSIVVKVPHNHIQGDVQENKKHMFLNVMRKKMQSDKTLNLRNVYEEVCNQDPSIKSLVPLKNVINEVCKHQLYHSTPTVASFEELYESIETDRFEKLHFTLGGTQFLQEKFASEDGGMAIVFANSDVISKTSESKLMYVDASFKIDTNENFRYQLVTVLVWVDDSYYPILYAIVSRKTQPIFKMIFAYLHDVLAPTLRPQEIVTDYEANVYYALGETYIDSHIGGSVFYYTQNLYKKICTLNLSRDLETNSFFRNIYHMLLMLPLLPVNTILDGLNNIEVQARDLNLTELTRPIFDHVRTQWIINVTPDLFCVHRLENRINENVIAPFKKLRDFLLLTKGKLNKSQVNVVTIVEKLIELDSFLQNVYSKPDKRSFGRDLSSYQKKNVLRAWQYIETHPKININNFFSKVLGYIKCMENQLWIWGFYRYDGDVDESLINAADFSIVGSNGSENEETENVAVPMEEVTESEVADENTVVVEAVMDNEIILQNNENVVTTQVPTTVVGKEKQFESAFLKYVYQ